MTFYERGKDWLAKPYSDDMSVGGWFAFIALLSILAFLWSRTLRFLVAQIQEV